MWCLSRKPYDPSSKDLIFSRTSIFSYDQRSHLQDLSFFITTNQDQQKPQDSEENNANSYALINQNHNPWQWFMYECSPMQFLAACVPPKTQIISILPDYFLCAQMNFPPRKPKSKEKSEPYAKLCIYVRKMNRLSDVPSRMEMKEGQFRDFFTAACALMDGWLYVAGGYFAHSSFFTAKEIASTPLSSAERLNLSTLMWEPLPSMLKPAANTTGIAHKSRFYVIGDGNYGHSAQIYNPAAKKWLSVTQFIPREANGYTVGSIEGRMILLTWSDSRGVRIWHYSVPDFSLLAGKWKLLHTFSTNEVERVRLQQNGAKLVTIGKEVFIMVGVMVNRHFCWVDGSCVWPILPAPSFRPCESQKVYCSDRVRAFQICRSGNNLYLWWTSYPIYRVGIRR